MNVRYLDLQAVNACYEPDLSRAVAETVGSGRYLRGDRVTGFETAFANLCGATHCIGTANGLDALTLILSALKELKGWADGDEVIVPAMTFVATALSVERAGLRPVFCDVDNDALISPTEAEKAITKKCRALIAVHLYGAPCDPGPLRELCDNYSIALIEDAAQAHGATAADGTPVGTYGTAAAFSFYPGKNLGALGDAGAVVTNDSELALTIRAMANYGAETKYVHFYHGINSRLDELQAAALSVKLPHLASVTARRRTLAARYAAGITNPAVTLPYGGRTDHSVFHIYPLRCSNRTALHIYLAQHGIETLIHYPLPLHHQPCFGAYKREYFPNSERIAEEELSLPLNSVITDEQADYIAETVSGFRVNV